jgi:hypothetical protein
MTSSPVTAALEDANAGVGPGLARILQIRRHAYNYKWTQAAARFPHLTSADAESFFTRDLAPLIEAVAALSPDHAETVCDAGVDVGLEATGLRLLGQNAPNAWVTQLWRSVLPTLAAHVVADPTTVLSDLSNATAQFDNHPTSRPEQWLRLLRDLGPEANDQAQLRSLGQLLAWRSGLAHYRTGALDAARQLPEPLRTAALELPVAQAFEEFVAELEASPWPVTQRAALTDPGSLARVGGFRGFGGPFPVPPTLATRRTDLLARSGNRNWLVTADLFGTTLHRVDDPGDYSGPNVRPPLQLFGGSMIFADGRVSDFSDSSPITGIVQGPGFAAVTTENSHVIRFIPTEITGESR